jgi:hypothetical protein
LRADYPAELDAYSRHRPIMLSRPPGEFNWV